MKKVLPVFLFTMVFLLTGCVSKIQQPSQLDKVPLESPKVTKVKPTPVSATSTRVEPPKVKPTPVSATSTRVEPPKVKPTSASATSTRVEPPKVKPTSASATSSKQCVTDEDCVIINFNDKACCPGPMGRAVSSQESNALDEWRFKNCNYQFINNSPCPNITAYSELDIPFCEQGICKIKPKAVSGVKNN
ncbi:MAG: hypothetical protein WCK11_02480 [Candidatus Falkowbacteria bacterium]